MLVTARTLWEVERPAAAAARGDNALFVTVVGHQWWWEYTYDHYNGQELGFTTANELHIPAERDGRRPAGLPDPEIRGRVPQLLGAPAGGQDRPDPGPHQSMWFQTDQPGLYLGPVRRVLRHPARQHAHPGGRRFARATSSAGWKRAEAGRGRPRRAGRGKAAVPRRSRASTATGCAALPPQGTYAPDLTHLMSRETLASGMVAEHPREPPPLDRRPAADQAGLPDAGLRPEQTASVT